MGDRTPSLIFFLNLINLLFYRQLILTHSNVFLKTMINDVRCPLSGKNRYREAVNVVNDALVTHGLNPEQITRGGINELRGGVACINLAGEAVDAAVILASINTSSYLSNNLKAVFRVDYAVRGNIRGVLPGRILSKTEIEFKGFLNKEITNLKWATPSNEAIATLRDRDHIFEAVAPSQGELWESGPHQSLTGLLNSDADLILYLIGLMRKTRNPQPITVCSDLWNESIRISNNSWLTLTDLPTFYTAKNYIQIIERISSHVKTVRRSFGGLTF
jgi:hypothetical protein